MNKKILFSILGIISTIIVFSLIISFTSNKLKKHDSKVDESFYNTDVENENNEKITEIEENKDSIVTKKITNEPIKNASNRITKKSFGIKISPTNSPVQPERFSGYHTGVDFEVFAEEENLEVDILTICTGKLIVKRWVSGYGGVAVQQCEINNESVTVVYGHLKLASISKNLNESIEIGDKIGVLGDGFSSETDGERKHLHLGIYGGESINLAGYVGTEEELRDWINYQSLINN